MPAANVPIFDLIETQEFQAAPLPNRLQALDESFIHNTGVYDEKFFNREPFAKNDEWETGRRAMGDAFSQLRDHVAHEDLKTRLNAVGDWDGSVVERIMRGEEIDEEEDGEGKLRGIVDEWSRDLNKTPSLAIGEKGATPRMTAYPLLNPKNPDDVLGHMEIFGDGRTTPYAEISLIDKENSGPEGVKVKTTRMLLKDDLKERIKDDESVMVENNQFLLDRAAGDKEKEQFNKSFLGLLSQGATASAGGLGMEQQDIHREGAMQKLEQARSHYQKLSGPGGQVANLTEQAERNLRQPGFIEHIGQDGFLVGLDSALGSLATAGMGINTGVATLANIGTDPGEVQTISKEKSPELAEKILRDSKAGRMAGLKVIDSPEGVVVRNETTPELFQKIHDDSRNIFNRRSRPEFEDSTWSRVKVGATDDVLPFVADLVGGISLAKAGTSGFAKLATRKGVAAGKEAAKLGELSATALKSGEYAASADSTLGAITKASESMAEMVQAGKRIERFSNISAPLVAGLPMNVKAAASSWADAMNEADEWEAQGETGKADDIRTNALWAAWGNFATGEGLGMIPMARMLKTAKGQTMEEATRAILREKKGGMAFLGDVGERTGKAMEFGAWSAANTVASNAWAKGLYDEHRELFRDVPEAAAIGMIHGFAIGDIAKHMSPRDAQAMAAQQRATEAAADKTKATVANRITQDSIASKRKEWSHLPEVEPMDKVLEKQADGTFKVNDPSSPHLNGTVFPNQALAQQAASIRHRMAFLQSLLPTQRRVGMKDADIAAQNSVISNFLDRTAKLAGLDPERLFKSMEVRDRPEGEEGVADPKASRVQRMRNLESLVAEGTKAGLHKDVLDAMQGRLEGLRKEIGAEEIAAQDAADAKAAAERAKAQQSESPITARTGPQRTTPEGILADIDAADAATRAANPPEPLPPEPPLAERPSSAEPATAAAEADLAQVATSPRSLFTPKGETRPPAPATPEGQPAPEPAPDSGMMPPRKAVGGESKDNSVVWWENDRIPQAQFEQHVNEEVAEMDSMRSQAEQLFKDKKISQEQHDQVVKFADDRTNTVLKAEVERQGVSRAAKDTVLTNLATVETQLAEVNKAITDEATPEAQLPNLTRRRAFLQKHRETQVKELRSLGQSQQGGQERRGSIFPLVKQGRAVIEAYKSADPTTLIHEISHFLTTAVDPVSGKSLLEAALGKHADAFNNWLGARPEDPNSKKSVDYHEKFTKGVETYLREGKTPTKDNALRSALAKVARMFKAVYKDLSSLNVDISPDARKGYDLLFGDSPITAKSEREQKAAAEGAPMTVAEAAAKAKQFEDGDLFSLNQLDDVGTRQWLDEISALPDDPAMPVEDMPARLDQGPTKLEDLRTSIWSWKRPGGVISRKMANVKKAPGFVKKLEEFAPASLRSRGALPETEFKNLMQARGLQDGLNKKAEIVTNNLDTAVNMALGIDPNPINYNYQLLDAATQKRRATLLKHVNNALLGGHHPRFNSMPRPRREAHQARLISRLPANVQPLVLEARAHMDAMSRQLIAIGAVQGDLAAIVDANRNFYMHRSYEFFDNPLWGERLRKDHPAIYDEAYNEFIKAGFTADRIDPATGRLIEGTARGQVERMLNPDNYKGNTSEEKISQWAIDRKNTSIFKNRNNEIPQWVLKLWGEHTDPFVNYTRTIAKQAQVLTTHQFYLQTLVDGTTEGWLSPRPTSALNTSVFGTEGQAGAAPSRRVSPLTGYYTTPEIAAVFRQVESGGNNIGSKALAFMAGVNWVAKNFAFTWNPSSHPKNFMGSAMLYLANGHWGALADIFKPGGGPIGDLGRAAGAHATGILPEWWVRALQKTTPLDRRASENEQIKLTRLGLMDQNVDIGILHGLAQRFRGAKSESDALAVVGGTIEGGLKKGQRFMEKAIQSEDSFWKVMNFYAEKAALAEAFPTKTVGEIERMAAEKTLDVFPSFNRLVPLAKAWSKNPFIGTFLAFRAETARVTYNMIRHGVNEMRTPGLRWLGARRLAGLATMRLAQTAAVSGMTKLMMGVYLDDEKDKASREFMKIYDKYASNAFAEMKDGKLKFINMSSIFPMSETTDAMNILAQNESPDRLLGQVVHKVLEPFLQEEFVVKLIFDQMKGTNDFGNPIANPQDTAFGMGIPENLGGKGVLQGRVGDRVEHALSMFIPGVLKSASRLVNSIQGTGKESIPAALSRVAGVRIAEVDVRKELPLVTTDQLNGIAEADDLFEKHFANGNEAQLKAGFEAMNARREKLFAKLHTIYKAAIALDVPAGEAIKIMDDATDRFTKESLSKVELASVITTGKPPPYRISKSKLLQNMKKDPQRAMMLLKMTIQPQEPVKAP